MGMASHISTELKFVRPSGASHLVLEKSQRPYFPRLKLDADPPSVSEGLVTPRHQRLLEIT